MYCVYLTTYHGKLLPQFYIGSTSTDKVNSGYRGSITSKKYRNLFIKELKDNPHLFETKILSRHNTRKEALEEENTLQRKLNVVSSNMYMNESFASENGFFGYDNSGELNGFFGKQHTEETLQKMRKPKASTEKYHKPKSTTHRQNISKNNAMHSLENRQKVGASKLGRKALYKDGLSRKMIYPNSEEWNQLITEGWAPKS